MITKEVQVLGNNA